jgi:plastocyanin
MRPKYLGAIVAAIIAVSACGGAGTGPSTAPATAPTSTNPGPTTSSAPAGETVEITVGTDTGAELKFDPPQVTIQAGTTVRVTFENRSSMPHNLTFQAPINVATATVVEPGSSETVEFKAPDPGEYAFVCTLHPGMAGTLIVTAS